MASRPSKGPGLKVVPLLALAAAGVLGNVFNYEIFFSIDFLFGSIFSLLALQWMGLAAGVFVGATASSVTYLLWNHPYAVVIMTGEVLFVGLLTRKKNLELVLADGLYWLVVGMPLVFLFYHGIMGLEDSNAAMTMFKQALNGVTNALLARLLFLAAQPRLARTAPPLRELVFNFLAIFVLVPSLVLLAVQSKAEFKETDATARGALRLGAERTSANLERFLRHRSNEIQGIAGVAAVRGFSGVQRSLEELMEAGEDFLRAGAVDREGELVAFTSASGGSQPSSVDRNFEDRPYIPILESTLRPMFSQVVEARIGAPVPLVTALAPVVVDGRYNGYVAGVLRLEGLDKLLSQDARDRSLPGLLYSLVDRNGRIIVSSRADTHAMDPFVAEAGEEIELGGGLKEVVPETRRNISVSERWRRSVYVYDGAVGPTSEWRLVLEQPVAPYQTRLYRAYAEKMTLVLGILLAALPLAAILSRGVAHPLRDLGAATANIPGQVKSGRNVRWPRSNIREAEHLIDNFQEVTEAMASDFGELRRVNQELLAALDEVKTLRGILPICSHCKKIRNDAGAWELMEAYVTRHSEAQFSHGLCPDCLAVHYPEYAERKRSASE